MHSQHSSCNTPEGACSRCWIAGRRRYRHYQGVGGHRRWGLLLLLLGSASGPDQHYAESGPE
eukprot:8617474-Heterocapsa_arctica.AAC.1